MSSEYTFKQMGEEEARAIAAWRYEPPYDFYDPASDPEDLEELLDPQKRRDYYSAFSGGELVGYLCFGAEATVPGGDYPDTALDIGLGLRPDLTGHGLGLGFLGAGLDFAWRRFAPESFRLSVAEFNARAIRVYEHAGFRKAGAFVQSTNGGENPFLMMTREA